MATAGTGLMTAEEFIEWASRPENADRRCELDRGEVIEMASPGALHGLVIFLLARLLGNYLFARGVGWATSNDTGLILHRGPDTVRGPDLMLFTEVRPFELVTRGYPDQMPQLVVEVVSPTDRPSEVNRKIGEYQRAGVGLIWLIEPELRAVTVYRRGHDLRTLDETDELSDPDVLPGFACRVAELFTTPSQGAA